MLRGTGQKTVKISAVRNFSKVGGARKFEEKKTVFWPVKPRSSKGVRSFGGTSPSILGSKGKPSKKPARTRRLAEICTCSSETSDSLLTTRRYNPDVRRENLKSKPENELTDFRSNSLRIL
jgi:hypothetical protein